VSQEETPPDQRSADEQAQSTHIEENVKSRSTWLRLFFMIVVALLYAISRVVVGAVVVLQFFWVLFTGATNKQLEQLGQSLATYTYQIIRYLTFNTDERPFPFDADWPTQPPEA
jgi:Flp pilus assembly protein TadB